MSDLDRKADYEVQIVGTDGVTKAKVDNNGSLQNQLYDASGNPLKGQKTMVNSLPIVIASDQIVPVSLSVSEETGFSAVFQKTITGSGTENNVLLLSNPAGSGKNIKLYMLTIGFSNTINIMATMRWYANPTVTANGTGLTIRRMKIGGSSSSACSAYDGPTTSATGTLYGHLLVSGGPNNSAFVYNFNGSLVLAPGNTILFTGTPDGTNRFLLFYLSWTEVSI